MKKILFFLFFAIAFSIMCFSAFTAQAQINNCGGPDISHAASFEINSPVSCSTNPDHRQDCWYTFSISSPINATFNMTRSAGSSYAKFSLYLEGPGLKFMDKTNLTTLLSAGKWTLVVYSWPPGTSFTLSISTLDPVIYTDTKKADGASCSSSSECSGGYCVHGYCRSNSYYCGDSYCDSGESCSSCSADCDSCGPVCGNDSCESGEDCSSCSWDCGSCAPSKKSDGYSCSSGDECSSGYCVHNVCRSSSAEHKMNWLGNNQYSWCGDGYCDEGTGFFAGEDCDDCSQDCGACKKGTGDSCSANSECVLDYCVHGICRSESTYCGDGYCDSQENCLGCEKDCGCAVGECCLTGSDVVQSERNYKKCAPNRSKAVLEQHDTFYCICCWGERKCVNKYEVDNHGKSPDCCLNSDCASGESCIGYFCTKQTPSSKTAKKADGEYCDKNEECNSGNCQNYRCCLKGKTCCLSTNNCPSEYYCSEEKHYCLPGLPNGQSCTKKEQCKSDNCQNNVCCDWGQACCQKQADCDTKGYCQTATYYCRDKWPLDSDCGDYGSAMCFSGYCDPDTRQCTEKPSGAEEPPAAPEEATVSEEIVVISLSDASLQKAETQKPAIAIQNKSQKEVILGEYILVENPIPSAVGTKISALRIFKKKLLPGETISTKSEDGQMEKIEEMPLTGLKQGSGAIKLRMVYFVDNQAKWLEDELTVSVSDIHIQKEETASQAFNQTMLLEEKREVIDATSSVKKEYVFVSVEDKSLQQAAVNSWQTNHKQMEKAVANLKDDFTGTVKPEILSFFETIKSLEEAKSSQEITEASIRAVAPPAIIAGFDFANLLDAIDKQKKVERGLLTHFNATDFAKVPIYDSQRNITGYTKAIVKEKDGKFYAVKIGDL